MTAAEIAKAARAALQAEFDAWLVARDHAQAQLNRISDERARLLNAETTALRLELAAKKGGVR